MLRPLYWLSVIIITCLTFLYSCCLFLLTLLFPLRMEQQARISPQNHYRDFVDDDAINLVSVGR